MAQGVPHTPPLEEWWAWGTSTHAGLGAALGLRPVTQPSHKQGWSDEQLLSWGPPPIPQSPERTCPFPDLGALLYSASGAALQTNLESHCTQLSSGALPWPWGSCQAGAGSTALISRGCFTVRAGLSEGSVQAPHGFCTLRGTRSEPYVSDHTAVAPTPASHAGPGGGLVSALLCHQPCVPYMGALISIPWGLPGDPGEPRNLRIPSFLICKSGMQIHTRFFVVFVTFCWLQQCCLPNLELLWGIQPPCPPPSSLLVPSSRAAQPPILITSDREDQG